MRRVRDEDSSRNLSWIEHWNYAETRTLGLLMLDLLDFIIETWWFDHDDVRETHFHKSCQFPSREVIQDIEC